MKKHVHFYLIHRIGLILILVLGLFTTSFGKIPHVVFLISKDIDNYEADKTIPSFADSLARTQQFKTTVLLGNGSHTAFQFPSLEKHLSQADLVVVFCRRVALPHAQMKSLQQYIQSGKPIIGLRTANHAFSLRGASPKKNYEPWWGFVPDILGHENKGYEPEPLGTAVSPATNQIHHPILNNVRPLEWQGDGAVYKVAPLIDPTAIVLLYASTPNTKEPAAWIRTTAYGGKVFYTSLGYPTDFNRLSFRHILVNAMHWCLQS